ncbi:MAG: EAL domain-containing protein [Helicobacteraceae bacterium]|nr:EAL domain-containing protein [Helicobacteraceae bacterium]
MIENDILRLFDHGKFILFKWTNRDNWPVEFVSSNTKEILDYDKELFLSGKIKYASIIHKDDIETIFEEVAINSKNEEIDSFIHKPYRIKKANGEYIWVYDSTSIVRDLDGDITHYIGYIADISDTIDLQKNLQLFENIFENAHDGILITDEKNKILSVNNAFKQITGYSQEDVVGMKPSILSSGKHNKIFYKYMWDSLLNKGYYKGEIQNRHKNGELFYESISISVIFDHNKNPQKFVAFIQDVTKDRLTQKKLEFLAHYDPLTTLPNKLMLDTSIGNLILQHKIKPIRFALLYLDLDNFKMVNDSLGHKVGDQLLVCIAEELKLNVKRADTIARQGGDEFYILINNYHTKDELTLIVENIYLSLKGAFNVQENSIHTTFSMGIALFPEDATTQTGLYKSVDMAMFKAKELGKNSYSFCTKDMHDDIKEKQILSHNLRSAIVNNEIYLNFQPQYNLKTSSIKSVEVLARWKNSELGIVPPYKFISVAEESGMILEIGNYIFEKACFELKTLEEKGFDDLSFSINISAIEFQQSNFIQRCKNTVTKLKLSPHKIVLELTESVLINDVEYSQSIINELREFGFRFSIDDFGTGYSSLAYLKNFSTDELKIDLSFIRELKDKGNEAIVKAILSLGESFDMKVVAEGVEEEYQLEFLREHNCDIIQGYYYSKPITIQELEPFIKKINSEK